MADISYFNVNTDGLYSDGAEVENDILKYVQEYSEEEYDQILKKDQRWPVFYHLSNMRENILNWYDFAPDADVLEIGGGMGALTGLLCRRVRSVTTVELTARRAQVIYARHANCDNLNILVGNFNQIEFEQKFDYITLIGVLEYAPGFTPGGDPADFLKKIHGLLKPGGKLLIAIENRFGLKYWCGANEDHTGKPYDGINGYPDTDSVRTFSRDALKTLLNRSGFAYQRFFYPLPDYKLPQVLYSDEWLPKDELASKIRQYYLGDPTILADEGKIFNDLIQEGVFPQFANSFFVECSDQAHAMSKVRYASFTPDRAPEYKVITVISNEQTVKKYAALLCGQGHMDTICNNQELYTGEDLISYRRVDDHLEMPFIKGQTLDRMIIDCIHHKDIEQLLHWISLYYEHVKKSSASFERDGQTILTHGFLDMTFSNCFVTEEGFRFFDQEWMEENVPAEYVLFHAFVVLYWEKLELNEMIPQTDLWAILQISNSKLEEYWEKVRTFNEKVIPAESNSLLFLDRCSRKPDANAFERMAAQSICGTVYFDFGDGYSQEHSQNVFYDCSQPFEIRIDVPSNAIRFRFDPIENAFCALRQLDLISDAGLIPVHAVNGETEDGLCWFVNMDPQIEAELSAAVHWLELSGELLVLQTRAGISLVQNLDRTRAELRQNRAELAELNHNHANLRYEYNRLAQEYDSLVQERDSLAQECDSLVQERDSIAQECDNLTQERESLTECLTKAKVENAELLAQLNQCQMQLERVNAELTSVTLSYNVISNSHFWKMTKPARVALDFVKMCPSKGKEYLRLAKKANVMMRTQGVKAVFEKYKERKLRLSETYNQADAYLAGSHSFIDGAKDETEPVMHKEWIDIQRKKPLISIVIAAKEVAQRAPYLKKTLASLCAQRYQNLEVILVADATDMPYVQEIVRSFDGRLVLNSVIMDCETQNRWAYWTTGAAVSNGSLIGYLEQEDTLTPNSLAYVLEAYNESVVRGWQLYLIPDESQMTDDETTFKDWKTGAGWHSGGAEGLLHFGVLEKEHFQPDWAMFEQWLLSLKPDQVFVAPWIGCHGAAIEDLWGETQVRCLAFYLPQFHEIPENNKWWGEGFTEWVNVKRAKPLYKGHHQPRIPGELGYYDLGGAEGAEVQKKQIALAKEYGLAGFCYYYYWFDGGKRLLEMPLDRHLEDKTIDFPFCLCWANENWTRQWDGQKSEVLMPQTYEPGWAEHFILDLLPYLKDERYIRVNGAPYLMIYNLQDIPNPAEAINTWRSIAQQNGIEKLHISAVRRTMDASELEQSGYTLDSLTDFPPHLLNLVSIDHDQDTRFGLSHGQVKDYRKASGFHVEMSKQNYTYFRTAMLEWDNTARRGKDAYIFEEFSIKEYQKWLYAAKRYALRQNRPGEDLVFINAWNEWAEGTYLEPSEPMGRAALESTKEVLERR